MASIQATKTGFISKWRPNQYPAIQGYNPMDEQALTIFPGEVPKKLPQLKSFWQNERLRVYCL